MSVHTFKSKFQAFLVTKINSETSFLYQLFKENLNIIVLKPCKLINEAFFYFHYYLYLFIYIYTPSNQHFKAFPVSKFNSNISFLYQLFKENSDFIVKKPCKVIYLSAFYDVFVFYLFIHTYIHLQINILKTSQCLKSYAPSR